MVKNREFSDALSPAPTSRGPRRSLALVTAATSLGLSLLLAEGVVRVLFRYNTPDTVRENSLQYLPSIFARHRLQPAQHVEEKLAWGMNAEAGRTGRVFAISRLGYRGPALEVPKPEGVVRVFVVGGSAVFDASATEGADWPALVERNLWAMGSTRVQVLNAGVPGHATFDSLGRLYSELWTLEPDYLVLYNAWNDIKYLRQISRTSPLISLFAPFDPTGDPFKYYRNRLDRWLSVSQIYVKLRTRYYLARYPRGIEGILPSEQKSLGDWNLGLRQYRLNVELFVDAARNLGAQPVLLTQATLVAADNDEEARSRISYEYQGLDHAALVAAFEDCHEVIRAVAREKAAPLLDLAKMLSGRNELFEDHVHVNREGSQALAAAVSEFLAELLDGDRRSSRTTLH